eukprot:scaffold143009_cov19-Tisochrysis_lutea.AAC.1
MAGCKGVGVPGGTQWPAPTMRTTTEKPRHRAPQQRAGGCSSRSTSSFGTYTVCALVHVHVPGQGCTRGRAVCVCQAAGPGLTCWIHLLLVRDHS